ncbi:unnamed protein product, partial [Cyprideis torosa]
ELTHAGEKAFSCSICVKGFRSKSLLHYHEKKHSEGIESGCALSFTQTHKLIDVGEKPVACWIYGRAFAYMSAVDFATSGRPPGASVWAHTGQIMNAEFKSFEERMRRSGERFEFRTLVSNHMTNKFIYNGEKLCLQNLWKIFCTQPPFIHAQVETYWRKGIQLLYLCQKHFVGSRYFTVTKRNTLKGINFPTSGRPPGASEWAHTEQIINAAGLKVS